MLYTSVEAHLVVSPGVRWRLRRADPLTGLGSYVVEIVLRLLVVRVVLVACVANSTSRREGTKMCE